MEINPYQSPTAEASDPPLPESPLRKLRGPTMGLLVLSCMMFFGCLINCAFFLPAYIVGVGVGGVNGGVREVEAFLCFALLFPNAAIFYGSYQARRGRAYRWALAAAILSCIPFLSPLFYFGIPLGVWMLLVLWRNDIRACFATNARHS